MKTKQKKGTRVTRPTELEDLQEIFSKLTMSNLILTLIHAQQTYGARSREMDRCGLVVDALNAEIKKRGEKYKL